MSIQNAKVDYSIVKARNVKLPFNAANVKRHWFAGDPWKTHAINALFMIIPEGERWVMNATRDLQAGIKNPELQVAAREFIRQEALHTREHAKMNQVMPEHGLPSKEIEATFSRLHRLFKTHASLELNASMASAFEHLTAVFTDALMDAPELMEPLDAEVRALLCWHVVEETEHKAVMFDILQEHLGTGPKAYALRVAGLLATMGVLVPNYFLTTARLLQHDGELTNVRSMARCIRDFYVSPGVIRKALQSTIGYLAPSFHPWEHDNRSKVKAWQDSWDETGDAIKATDAFLRDLLQRKHGSNRSAAVVPRLKLV